MSTKELRALDTWIAENIMGLEVDVCENNGGELRCFIYEDGRPATSFPTFEPTTDAADAMEVLKVCRVRCGDITLGTKFVDDDNQYIAKASVNGWIEGTAPTIELAISLFAQKLYKQL